MRVQCKECLTESSIRSFAVESSCPRCGRMLGTDDTDRSAATASFDKTNRGAVPTAVGRSQSQMDEPDDVDLTFTPERIGSYQILGQAGRGGFGIVYQGLDTQLNTPVAIKVARAGNVGDSDDAMLAEARTQAKLRHPHIVRVLSADRTEEGQIYLVMDWVGGPTLRDHIAGRQLPVDETLQIIIKVAEAIHFAHQQDFVHRDLKPNNILLDDNQQPFVADFGLAIDDAAQRLRPDEFAGTMAYMAPEQIRRESQFLDGRADVWALGVMLYEMLGGKRPFRGEREALRAEILKRDPKPLRLLNEQVPASLETVIKGCLEKDVRARTPTARELCEQLQQELRRWQSGGRRRPAWTPWLVGLSCLLAVVGAGAYAVQNAIDSGSDNRGVGDRPPIAIGGGLAAVGSPLSADAADSNVKYLPMRWNKVLDQPLVKRTWPPPSSTSLLSVDRELEQFTAIVDGVANLKCGTINFDSGSLRVDVHQPDWTGNFGLYYGWRSNPEVPGTFICECIDLLRVPERDGRVSHRLDRLVLLLDAELVVRHTAALSSVSIPSPQAAAKTCVVTFHDGQLESLSWDGEVLPDILPDRYIHPPVGCRGDFGIFLSETALTVSRLRVFPDTSR